MSDGPPVELWSDRGTFAVASGVHRIPLPLPDDGLKAVNVYALDDGRAVTLIDSGWLTVDVPEVLDAGLNRIDRELSDVHRVLVTHIHRDHYTLATEIRRRFGARIELGVDERPSLERIMGEEPRMRSLDSRLYRGGAGHLVDHWRRRAGSTPRPGWEVPDEWMAGGSTVEVGDRTLDVLATPGHTRGHLVFHDRAGGLLFSGDHVLPHITPSIGFEPVPSDSPLAAYLTSLALVRERPDARLLPAHGQVADSVHLRIDELFVHHDQRLSVTYQAVVGGAGTALEVAIVLRWTRRDRRFEELDFLNQMLAVNETLAHLDVLVERGLLAADETETPTHFRAIEPGGEPSG